MEWIKRVFGKTPGHDTDPNLSCSFCGRLRAEVHNLIRGPSVLICDNCLGLCEQILDDQAFDRKDPSYFSYALLDALGHLGPRAPFARTRPLLRALIELDRQYPTQLRRGLAIAIALDDVESAVMALRALDTRTARTTAETLKLATLLIDVAHYDEALLELGIVTADSFDARDRLHRQILVIVARLESGKLAAVEVSAIRANIHELETATNRLPTGEVDSLRSAWLGANTLAALAAGAIDAAADSARARVSVQPVNSVAHEQHARVLSALGDFAGEHAALARGRAIVHPESAYAIRLARLAATTPTSPFR
jgi:ClpX C4-type zinc finger